MESSKSNLALAFGVFFLLILFQLAAANYLSSYFLPFLICAALAATLLCWIIRSKAFAENNKAFFLILLALSFFVHFRGTLFFFGDEWDFLRRLSFKGFSGVIYTHNEHFIPFFFTAYFVEVLVFGANYFLFILVSILIHAANAYAVSRLLRRVLAQLSNSSQNF